MNREQIKTHMADYCETLGVCLFLNDGATDVAEVHKGARKIQVRASRHRGDGCLLVTESAGEWSAYYSPDENGRLILKAFSFGVPPGEIAMTLDGEKVLNHFAADLAITNKFDA